MSRWVAERVRRRNSSVYIRMRSFGHTSATVAFPFRDMIALNKRPRDLVESNKSRPPRSCHSYPPYLPTRHPPLFLHGLSSSKRPSEMAQTKTTKKRKASPNLTESDIDDVPPKRRATARKSTGGVPVGRRLPAGSSAGPSTRRASGAQPAWGTGSRGDGGGGSKCYVCGIEFVVELFPVVLVVRSSRSTEEEEEI